MVRVLPFRLVLTKKSWGSCVAAGDVDFSLLILLRGAEDMKRWFGEADPFRKRWFFAEGPEDKTCLHRDCHLLFQRFVALGKGKGRWRRWQEEGGEGKMPATERPLRPSGPIEEEVNRVSPLFFLLHFSNDGEKSSGSVELASCTEEDAWFHASLFPADMNSAFHGEVFLCNRCFRRPEPPLIWWGETFCRSKIIVYVFHSILSVSIFSSCDTPTLMFRSYDAASNWGWIFRW